MFGKQLVNLKEFQELTEAPSEESENQIKL